MVPARLAFATRAQNRTRKWTRLCFKCSGIFSATCRGDPELVSVVRSRGIRSLKQTVTFRLSVRGPCSPGLLPQGLTDPRRVRPERAVAYRRHDLCSVADRGGLRSFATSGQCYGD